MLMMDPSISAEGGFYHKECFKCTQCKGQLTLLNFAQIKGVLVRGNWRGGVDGGVLGGRVGRDGRLGA